MAGAHCAVLQLGRPAQQRLQAGAGGYQSVSRRLQQPESGFHVAVRAGGAERDREDLPGSARCAADSGKPHAQPVLFAERGAPFADSAQCRPESAHRQPAAGNHAADHAGVAERCVPDAGAHRAQRQPSVIERWLRPLRGAAQQRPFCRRAGLVEESGTGGAAAAGSGLDDAAQVAPLCRLRQGGRRICQAAQHRSVADQPVFCGVRQGRFSRAHRRRLPRGAGGFCAADRYAPNMPNMA